MSDLDLIAREAATSFVLDGDERIRGVNSPEGLTPPRLYLARCRSGNIVRIRHDLPASAASAIKALAACEPPLQEPETDPVHLSEYLRLLVPAGRAQHGLTWVIPDQLDFDHPAPLARSGTPEGDRLFARFRAEGMPQGLIELGFVDTGEF